jgi:uncharacterized protein YgiB involved in biofilm formation
MRRFALSAILLGSLQSGCSAQEQDRPLLAVDDRRAILIDLYSTVDECSRSARLDPATCSAGQAEANLKHPRYAPRWNSLEHCEEEHGRGSCAKVDPSICGQQCWSPRPVGFFVRNPAGAANEELYFAPVYDRARWGLYTGQGGGSIGRTDETVTRPERRQIGARLIERPVI